jgi:hypothetical protein
MLKKDKADDQSVLVFLVVKVIFKRTISARHWWITPLILATLEAEIGRIVV